MRVALDVSPLYSGHRLRGVGSYTQSLTEALRTYEPEHTFTLIKDRTEIPKDADVIHYPYFDPFFLTLSRQHTQPTVVTVHDLIPLVFPQHFPAGIRGRVKWLLQKQALTGTNMIIADSIASKQDITRIAGIPQDRISVVYLAPAENFKRVEGGENEKVRKKYGLPQKFILYVGDINWNKNIPNLLHAFAGLRKRHKDISLVLLGKAFLQEGIPEYDEINSVLEKLQLGENVVRPGAVLQEELPVIYSLAALYVQPSVYEGFGLPVLEAMACGCPVVCAHTSSLREIGGPAIATGTDPGSIARGLERALEDTTGLVRLQNEWVDTFSWKKAAHQTVAVYKQALQSTK